jgi:hypothetical protein
MSPVVFPELTFLQRISEIPLIDGSIGSVKTLHSTVLDRASPFLQRERISSTIATVKAASATATTKAVDVTRPYHGHLATALERLDGYAHKGLDKAEEKYPTAFEITTEEFGKVFHERRRTLTQRARELAVKALEREVREVAIKRFDEKVGSPFVTYIETQVASRLKVERSTPSEGLDSYKRAVNLSKDVTGGLKVYTSGHLKQIREKNPLADRALETAESLSAVASTSISSFFGRFSSVSEKLNVQLAKLKELSLKVKETTQERVKKTPLPAPVRKVWDDALVLFEARVKPFVLEARDTILTEATRTEKIAKLREQITKEGTPLLLKAKEGSVEFLARSKQAAIILKEGKRS